jgi:hypothetical protein
LCQSGSLSKPEFHPVKNGKPLAQLVPEGGKMCTGRELAEALAHVELSPAEAIAWRKDLLKARKSLKTRGDKWR